jgi:hypothetical protein
MAKKKKTSSKAAPEKVATRPSIEWKRYSPVILILVVLVFYWTPLTSSNASIQWDAADEFQPGQKYLSDELHSGRIPFWTPYIWAGFPILADPQLGAWYPLNWPFLLIGPTPGVFEVENLLHALLACYGAYLLAKRLFGHEAAALFAGISYGLSGFFAAHSSHTPMFQAAAWLPWLLLVFTCAVESRVLLHGTLGVLVSGMIILAGHFQTALYCFLAVGLFAVARVISAPSEWRRAAVMSAALPLGGALLSAVGMLPGLELATNSIRTGVSAISRTEGFLNAGSLATLLYPNFYGAISGKYVGPEDITQYYFYAGILLLPLAALGLLDRSTRRICTCLIVPSAWYAAGYALGLYYVAAQLPGFRNVRAPIHVWFVVALGFSLLAAGGLVWATKRWPWKWLPFLLVVVTCVDLWYWNSETNPLTYAHDSYAETYGAGERLFERAVVPSVQPLTRFDAPERIPTFGPFDHPLDMRVETTYGYNPLMLSRYADYENAMRGNPKLKNGLNVSSMLDAQHGTVVSNGDMLPRVTIPKKLLPVSSGDDARHKLATLDPAESALVPAQFANLRQDPQTTVQVTNYSGDSYRIHYRSSMETLLRISAAFFPGWTAQVDNRPLDVHPVDHALIGVVVPPGENELVLKYHSNYFGAGAGVSLVALLACVAVIVNELRTDLR